MSKLLSSDTSYRDWIQEVSKRFRQSQIRAAVKVNDEMLRFYWSLGKDISRMSENAAYGTGFYKAVSADLQDIFPNVHSFSVTNLKYMRYFYEMYPITENRQQVVDDSRQASFFISLKTLFVNVLTQTLYHNLYNRSIAFDVDFVIYALPLHSKCT